MRHTVSRRVADRTYRLAILIVLVLTGLLAAAPAALADPGPGWRGEYYNNMSLAGAPALVRDDPSINFDWANGSPAGVVNSDHFSVRWTGWFYFDGGDYAFRSISDDGIRVWVDGVAVIDQWHDHPATEYVGYKYLAAGNHSLQVEQYENVGAAVAKVRWERVSGGPPGPITDWRAEYYNNSWLGGTPAIVRNDATINFDWGYGSPAAGIVVDNFSARWTRTVSLAGGNYSFSVTTDDGVRVWADGALIIDKWYAQARTTHSATVYLGAGGHNLKVEYFERTGTAACMLTWTGDGGPGPGPWPGPFPGTEVIVDDRDSNFVWGGSSGSWYARSTGFRSHLYWTWNSRTQLFNWGKWIPYLPQPGNWEVYVYIASRYHGSKSARYQIHHSGGTTQKVVNQNNYYGQWVSLGSYHFGVGSNGYVYLSDVTGETYGTRYLGYDAVKWVLRGGAPGPFPGPIPGPIPPPSSGCSIDPVLGFGRIWHTYPRVRTKLGCPTENEVGTWAAQHPFQSGLMLWQEYDRSVSVLYNNGTWQGYNDTWMTGDPEYDPGIVAPGGYYQPIRGFGRVWRDNHIVRTGLGWGTTEEQGFNGSSQKYEHGRMFWSPTRGIFVLYSDGTWERFD